MRGFKVKKLKFPGYRGCYASRTSDITHAMIEDGDKTLCGIPVVTKDFPWTKTPDEMRKLVTCQRCKRTAIIGVMRAEILS